MAASRSESAPPANDDDSRDPWHNAEERAAQALARLVGVPLSAARRLCRDMRDIAPELWAQTLVAARREKLRRVFHIIT